MSTKKEKLIKINKWVESIKNSNEKRVIDLLKIELPRHRIVWNEEKFTTFYTEILNSLPTRYKQKNSIELSGKIKKDIIIDAIRDRIEQLIEADQSQIKQTQEELKNSSETQS